MTQTPWDGLDKSDDTRSSGERLLLSTFAADYPGCEHERKFQPLRALYGCDGGGSSRVWGTTRD